MSLRRSRILTLSGWALVLTLAAALAVPGRADPARAAKKKPRTGKGAPSGVQMSVREQAVLKATNRERRKRGLPPLRPDARLFEAARAHSENMARRDTLAHTLAGSTPEARLRASGYRFGYWGENVAVGQRTARQVLATWMGSRGHRANILRRNFTEIGIGIAPNAQGRLYYTQVFGAPRGR